MKMILTQYPHTNQHIFSPEVLKENNLSEHIKGIKITTTANAPFMPLCFFFLNHKWFLLLEDERECTEGPETSSSILGSTHQLLAEMQTYFPLSITIFKVTTICCISQKKAQKLFHTAI